MQYMNDDHSCVLHTVKNQVIAVNAPADTMVFVAGDEGKAVRIINEILAFAPQFPDE